MPTKRAVVGPGHTRQRPAAAGRYTLVVVSTDALQASIEQRLQDISEEVEQLRAALEALGPNDTSRPNRSRAPRRARREMTEHAVMEARVDGQAMSPGVVAEATQMTPSTIPAALPRGTGNAVRLAGKDLDCLALPPAGAVAATPPDDPLATPLTGADRAVQSLRRELAAGLRNGRG